MGKYFKITSISLKNSLTYFKDFIVGNVFVVLIIIIYLLLWKNLYSNNVKTGFTFQELIWYLIINEVVFMNNIGLFKQVEKDIKGGNIAYHLNKPYSYPLFMLFDSIGKSIGNLIVNIIFGAIVGMVIVGILPGFKLLNIIPMLLMMMLGVVLNITIYIFISLTSFWFEENRPFVWIYRQLVFAFGGFLIPITMFPEKLYKLTLHMPWTYISFHTSSSIVKFSFWGFLNTVLWQTGYIILFLLLTAVTFRRGAERLNVNGG